ncbi:hypothetical protein [Rhodoferax sp. WC2427]|uniref:hypothetical protein n=1 Tax=Rhodoferax sp. WC2427 TaxID=3234144 RepID=UPI0034660AB0
MPSEPLRLAVLTGGSTGLGLALCEALAECGYRVLELSRSAPHAYSVQLDLGFGTRYEVGDYA